MLQLNQAELSPGHRCPRQPTRWLIATTLLLFAASGVCSGDVPTLSTLDPDNAKEDGARLIKLPYGLTRLDSNPGPGKLLVAIHGYGSRGLEWVYPVVTLSQPDQATYFFRWDWNGCPAPAAKSLLEGLQSRLREMPQVAAVELIGHSYGGVLVHEALRMLHEDASSLSRPGTKSRVALSAHIIASPLAGLAETAGRCDSNLLTAVDEGIELHEWRTLQHLDGAFKDRETDPQVVSIKGSTVTRLPETYRNRRLGHNWSISWVADELVRLRSSASQPH